MMIKAPSKHGGLGGHTRQAGDPTCGLSTSTGRRFVEPSELRARKPDLLRDTTRPSVGERRWLALDSIHAQSTRSIS